MKSKEENPWAKHTKTNRTKKKSKKESELVIENGYATAKEGG
jgi:hypothetical protein